MADNTASPGSFIFVVCQHGAETAAKKEIIANHPQLRLAFSRPGFLTFKIAPDERLPKKFTLRSTLARTYGWSLGKVEGEDAEVLAADVATDLKPGEFEHLHVWERDPAIPGSRGFEPGPTPLANEIAQLVGAQLSPGRHSLAINRVAKPLDRIADLIIVEPGQWWYGFHFATTAAGRWPGGVPRLEFEGEMISRAYLKIQEAIAWTGMTIGPGDVCAEIGSAPGGSCQYLLERGATVIGIDPAEMDETVLENEHFRHIRKRGHEVKKKEFKNVKWLFADINIVPNYTLDTIADIVGHPGTHIQGMILTLKMTDWKFVEEVPALIDRVREMGFLLVKVRQLAFNRREFCLAAFTDKFVLRIGKKRPQHPKYQNGNAKPPKPSGEG
jgi:23S rRNA (cytidine2498-2'-O)-methyltransferase